eukprot:XP_012826083.1 PREDICTED: rab11 family-interacting protein 3 isoform X1 [Xenopus tropicalis]
MRGRVGAGNRGGPEGGYIAVGEGGKPPVEPDGQGGRTPAAPHPLLFSQFGQSLKAPVGKLGPGHYQPACANEKWEEGQAPQLTLPEIYLTPIIKAPCLPHTENPTPPIAPQPPPLQSSFTPEPPLSHFAQTSLSDLAPDTPLSEELLPPSQSASPPHTEFGPQSNEALQAPQTSQADTSVPTHQLALIVPKGSDLVPLTSGSPTTPGYNSLESDQVPHPESSCLYTDLSPTPGFNSLESDQVPHPESPGLNTDLSPTPGYNSLESDQVPHPESSCLYTDLSPTPGFNSLESDQMPHPESPVLYTDLSPTPGFSYLESDQVPNPEPSVLYTDLSPTPGYNSLESDQVPNPESPVLNTDLSPTPGYNSLESDQVPNPESPVLNTDLSPTPGFNSLESDQVPNPESSVLNTDLSPTPGFSSLESDQVPNPESSVLNTALSTTPGSSSLESDLMPQLEADLPPSTRSLFFLEPEVLPQSETCLNSETRQLSPLDTRIFQSSFAKSTPTPETDHLPWTNSYLPPDADDIFSDKPFHLQCDQFSLSEMCLDSPCDQLPESESILTPTSKRLSQSKSSLASESVHLLQSETCLLPENDQIDTSSCLPCEPDQLLLSKSCLPSDMTQWPLCGPPLDGKQATLPDSCLHYKKSLLPWDWTPHQDQHYDHGFDFGSENFRPFPQESDDLPFNGAEDQFAIFRLDTPPQPDQVAESDHPTLSEDLLFLSDAFAHLEVPHPQKESEHSSDLYDQFPFMTRDPLSSKEELAHIDKKLHSAELIPDLSDQVPCTLPDFGDDHVPLIRVKDQLTKTERTQPAPNNVEEQYLQHSSGSDIEHDHGNIGWSDQSQSYYLDLLFGTDNLPSENDSCSHSCTRVTPTSLEIIHENDLFSSSNSMGHANDSEVQCYSDSYIETKHPLSVKTSPDKTPPLYLPNEQVLNHFDVKGNIVDQFNVGSSSKVEGSPAEFPGESNKLPLIIVTDPLPLSEQTQSHERDQLPSFPEALPDELPHCQTDTPLESSQVPLCKAIGQLLLPRSDTPPESIQLPLFETSSSDLHDTTSQMPLSQTDGPSEDTSLPLSSANLPLALCPLESAIENVQLPPCEDTGAHQPAGNPQEPALAPTQASDTILGLALETEPSGLGDELARLRAVFDALDRDKDGFVKMEDFVQFATVYGAEQVKYLTGYLDPAGLGVINFRDFYRGISEIQNEDLDMQLYDMGYPSEEEPACSVDFDDLAAFEVTEVTDSAYVGSESAYSECETFTDEDTGVLAPHEDPETEGVGGVSRLPQPTTPEGLELSLCDISVITVTSQEEQFEDFGEGAEPDLFSNHCNEEENNGTLETNATQRLSPSGASLSERQLLAPPPCSSLGGLYCSQCHKHVNRLEDLSTRLRYLEMDSPDKRPSSRKEARRLQHSFLGEDSAEQQLSDMACDETDLTDKVLFLEQRISELERDAATTSEQQNRLRQENLQLLHRAHALEEQLKDQELRSDEVQSEEIRKHRDELRKMERDNGYQLSSLKARVQELENENSELRSQVPDIKATVQRLEEEKLKLQDEVEVLQGQVKEQCDSNQKLSGQLSKEKHNQQSHMERCQEVIEELRRELEQMQLVRLDMEHRLGLGNSAALQEYNSRTREAELEHEVRRLKQEQRALKEQNEELNGQIINLSIQGAKNLFSTTFSDSLAAEISNVSRDELMEAIQKQEEINLRLQDYIDRIIVAIMETNPAILEVKIH